MDSKPMKFKGGDIVYTVFRDVGDICLGKAEIVDAVQTYTPTGRPRKPFYKVRGISFKVGDSQDFEEASQTIEDRYFRSAVTAVSESLRRLFEEFADNSPEARLLNALFANCECKPKIPPEYLGPVISDLLKYQKLLAKAFDIDNAMLMERRDELKKELEVKDNEAQH